MPRSRAVAAASVLGFLAFANPRAQAAHGSPQELLGVWRGSSICTDRVALPACTDEDAIYEFVRGSKNGTVRWLAGKMVGGQRALMGESDIAFDAAEQAWKAALGARIKTVWRLTVDGAHMKGPARLL